MSRGKKILELLSKLDVQEPMNEAPTEDWRQTIETAEIVVADTNVDLLLVSCTTNEEMDLQNTTIEIPNEYSDNALNEDIEDLGVIYQILPEGSSGEPNDGNVFEEIEHSLNDLNKSSYVNMCNTYNIQHENQEMMEVFDKDNGEESGRDTDPASDGEREWHLSYTGSESNTDEAENEDEMELRNKNETVTNVTKTGEKRRRRKFKYTTSERKTIKQRKIKYDHPVKPGCGQKCKKQCKTSISEERRSDINHQFWNLNREKQTNFVLSNTRKSETKRQTVGPESRRCYSLTYSLKDRNGESKSVCKTFFLRTLGYHKNNDKVIQYLCKSDKSLLTVKTDGRKGKQPHHKLDHSVIEKHVESFNPSISHYRREHAPSRRYLPSNLTIKDMFADFQIKHPCFSCSYDLYRSIVQRLNISFVKLGHEECESCEHFKIHPHSKDNLQDNCDDCKKWNIHIKKAEAARTKYKEHANKDPEDGEVIYSVDLEKVIMLPRCEMFKSVIFTQRLTVYNESFVPVGIKNRKLQPIAALWHEAIIGRKKENIISTFYKFFLTERDAKKIILWVDNCTSRNKNWAFFTFLVYAVNSPMVSADTIQVNYLEPGHTFMSADSFHHQVEKSLKKMKKVYDFTDFKSSVQSANSNKVTVMEMHLTDFFSWKDYSSLYKINRNHADRPYIHDMVQVEAQKGSMSLSYRKDFDGPQLPLNFLNAKVRKSQIPTPKEEEKPKGISQTRRDNIISKLIEAENAIIPKNRLHFWKELPLSDNGE